MKLSPVQIASKQLVENRLLTNGSKLIIAVSGGVDSTALLHILGELDIELTLFAVYIDHSLRPDEVEAEIDHVKSQAEIVGAQFITKKVDTILFQKSHKKSREEAARILRYQTLHNLLDELKADFIVVGHTADDQVEEFFLRALRGSGRAGLSGMRIKTDKILRPLLSCSKKELETYLQKKGIPHCEDSSNSERKYTRNRVRLDLLPIIEELNPNIRETVLNNTKILQEEEDYLLGITETHYSKCVNSDKHNPKNLLLDLNYFLIQHTAIQRRLLESLCWQMNTKPGFIIIETLLEFSKKSLTGKTITLEKGLRVTKLSEELLFHKPFKEEKGIRKKTAVKENLSLKINSPSETESININSIDYTLTLITGKKSDGHLSVDTLVVDLDKLTFPLHLRYGLPGEKFKPANGNCSKKINRYLTEKKIRTDQRHLYPVLVSATDEIIAVLGLAIDDQFKVRETTKDTLVINWQPSDS